MTMPVIPPCFKAIFDVLGKVQHLGSTRFAGAEASLLWYKDMFDNGRQAVQYQSLVQFVEVTRKDDEGDQPGGGDILE